MIGAEIEFLGGAETPRSPEELLAITTLPIDPPQSDFPFRPETVYRARVLRHLEWFGLLEKVRMAANDQVGEQHLYRKHLCSTVSCLLMLRL